MQRSLVRRLRGRLKRPLTDLALRQVAERTAADKKGGHLCKRKSDGRLLLRESAMVQDEDKKAFEDISKCARKLLCCQ